MTSIHQSESRLVHVLSDSPGSVSNQAYHPVTLLYQIYGVIRKLVPSHIHWTKSILLSVSRCFFVILTAINYLSFFLFLHHHHHHHHHHYLLSLSLSPSLTPTPPFCTTAASSFPPHHCCHIVLICIAMPLSTGRHASLLPRLSLPLPPLTLPPPPLLFFSLSISLWSGWFQPYVSVPRVPIHRIISIMLLPPSAHSSLSFCMVCVLTGTLSCTIMKLAQPLIDTGIRSRF